MKKNIYVLLTLSYLFLANISISYATPIATNYDFRNGNSTLYNSINFAENSVGLTVTAFMKNDLNEWLRVQGGIAGVFHGSTGLGTQLGLGNDSNMLDGASNNLGNDRDEGLLFSFTDEVSLTHIDFANFSSRDDFNLEVDGVNTLVKHRETNSSGFTEDEYYFPDYIGTSFMIWSETSTSSFYIQDISISHDSNPIPIPATFLLVSSGFMLLLGSARRRKSLSQG